MHITPRFRPGRIILLYLRDAGTISSGLEFSSSFWFIILVQRRRVPPLMFTEVDLRAISSPA